MTLGLQAIPTRNLTAAAHACLAFSPARRAAQNCEACQVHASWRGCPSIVQMYNLLCCSTPGQASHSLAGGRPNFMHRRLKIGLPPTLASLAITPKCVGAENLPRRCDSNTLPNWQNLFGLLWTYAAACIPLRSTWQCAMRPLPTHPNTIRKWSGLHEHRGRCAAESPSSLIPRPNRSTLHTAGAADGGGRQPSWPRLCRP